MAKPQVFISYSGDDFFEALLQFAIEKSLGANRVIAWTYQRDQRRSASAIARALKTRVRESVATIFLVSPSTINCGAAQRMELACAAAYDVTTIRAATPS